MTKVDIERFLDEAAEARLAAIAAEHERWLAEQTRVEPRIAWNALFPTDRLVAALRAAFQADRVAILDEVLPDHLVGDDAFFSAALAPRQRRRSSSRDVGANRPNVVVLLLTPS